MPQVQMFLDDPQKSVVLGIPPTAGRKIHNAFYEACELDQQGKHKEAERIFLHLLSEDFDNCAVLAALGMNYAYLEKSGLAFALLSRALERIDDLIPAFKRLGITPKPEGDHDLSDFIHIKRSELYNAIGTCHKHEQHVQLARQFFNKAQEGLPPNADIQNNLGTLYINEGHPERALPHLDEAIKATPTHPQSHWNRSLAYLELGDYERGWPEYDWGLTAKVRMERDYTKPNDPRIPYWRGEKGARLVIYGEQGIGDEILFASMLPDLLKDVESVVFECHMKLHKLFANSFPSIDMYPTREDPNITWAVKADGTYRYNFTHKLALGSLGRFYRPNLESFPGTAYLTPTPESELHWAEWLAKLPPGPKIGISWVGGHKKTRVEVRSLRLEEMLPIILEGKDKGAQFVSLQYTPHEDELAEFERIHGIKIHMAPEACYSGVYDDTAGLVANLDLVITVCTSVVHLAGALGVPVWVLTPSRPAWRYRLDLDTLPWYKHSILFRQARDTTDWAPVVEEVRAALSDLFTKPSVAIGDAPQE